MKLIREYYHAFTAAGGSARFELFYGIPGNGHLLLLYPDRWRPIADQFLATLDPQKGPEALPQFCAFQAGLPVARS
ncbi:hypothetical protein [Bradyrhizobium sp. AZCC 2289]|uniref:hypothetical protein n=1 Tax=Bradyrhizobium sp. AZCC 2289 TaxID=3117026 RepID=UPI002FF35765